MATQIQSTVAGSEPVAAKYNLEHPLCALGPEEIKYTAELIRSLWPEHTDLRFKTITIEEPAKAQLLPYLQAKASGQRTSQIDRKAFTSYYIRNTVCSPLGDLSNTDRQRTDFMKPSST